MKKLLVLFLTLGSLFLSGCAIFPKSYYPFSSQENKQAFITSTKTYSIKDIKVISEKSKRPEKNGYKNDEELTSFVKEDLAKKLEKLSSNNPTEVYDLVIEIDLNRSLNLLNANAITGIQCYIELDIMKNSEKIAHDIFNGKVEGSLKSILAFSNREKEDTYYYMVANTIIKMIRNLENK